MKNEPILVIQNDVGNKYSPTVIVAAITSRQSEVYLPKKEIFSSKESKRRRAQSSPLSLAQRNT